MPTKKPRKRPSRSPTPEVLNVAMTAELLTVSIDTVYDLFKHGAWLGRKVGRKWLTTRNAVLRWIERSSEHDTLAWAIEQGNHRALEKTLNRGRPRSGSGNSLPSASSFSSKYIFEHGYILWRQPDRIENCRRLVSIRVLAGKTKDGSVTSVSVCGLRNVQ